MEIQNKYCWLCGDLASTREHQIKKSDVEAAFGKGSYRDKKVIKKDYDKGGKKFYVQGPDSYLLKYTNNLCVKCNNERTQPHDKAYQLFSDYIRNNFSKLEKNKRNKY